MALIICEECGKQFSDRAAACPNCGCPVPTQNQEAKGEEVAKYLNLAINAIKANNSELVEKYCQAALEIDANNSKAWELQARGILFNSTLKSNKIPQAITCADNAVKFSTEDKSALATNLYDTIASSINGLLEIALSMPIMYSSQYVLQVMNYYSSLLCGISNLPKNKILAELATLQTMDDNSKKAIMPKKRMFYASLYPNPSWAEQIKKQLQAKGIL